jgi:fatty acid-binding protein DegV
LNSFTIDAKYPSEIEFTIKLVREALADAHKIYTFQPIVSAYDVAKADYELNYKQKVISITIKAKIIDEND